MRQVLIAGAVLWVSAAPIDWVMSQRIYPGGSFEVMAAVRVVSSALLLLGIVLLGRQPPPSATAIRRLWRVIFVAAGAAQGAFTVALGQISSAYANGAAVVVVACGLATPDHWRSGLRMLGPTAVAYPVAILGAAALSPTIAHRLGTEVHVLALLVDLTVLFMGTALMVASGHAFWALRRELFEARRLGGYRLKSRIAVGGMGEVWRAWHGALKRDVAIKILRLDLTEAAAAARFEREAAATAALSHPNTVRVLDYGITDDGLSFFAMELLDGITLQELVEREGPLPPARVVHLLAQASAALAEAHRHGIIHRDIKPSNLLVTTTGGVPDFVKLIDFGIARRPRNLEDATLTRQDMVVGTPAYMAPEQAVGGTAEAPTDVYALGAVAYFALAGYPVFAGATPEVVLGAHLRELPIRVALRATQAVPEDLDQLVMRCLAKDPRDRFSDAGALAEALAMSSLAGRWRPQSPVAEPVRAPAADDLAFEPTRPLDRA